MLESGTQITERENIHDLRNLFGIVSSASHLLGDDPTPNRRAVLLDAISEAARRGGTLTTALLAKETSAMVQAFDLNRHLGALQSLLDAQSNSGVEVSVEVSAEPSPVKLDSSAFDAAILELVTNARGALNGTGRILVRTKRVGRRIWVIVADTGQGMGSDELSAILLGARPAGAHGTGLGRVRHFAQAAHAHFHIRSVLGRGTVAALAIPLILQVTISGPSKPLGMSTMNDPERARRLRRSAAQRDQKWAGAFALASQPGEPKPDIIEPSAPPETPAPPQPAEVPIPFEPEGVPTGPDFVPEPSPQELPAGL
ncbi:HAMP domain-containing sensor histidine kinase [Sphingobium sp. D43FB]|uniref:sensor histidine kinase n=1 Tax=Sphingobium sp. D43FB TaxID=2017595 RepID=UPI000BB56E5B|nr:HAMP domain-containing sensor histidine kinase [Sphingobium sp. D43FB]PBN42931.1 hypothetical protein SxD43FB_13955 [Sphingobium sp. D43FB]